MNWLKAPGVLALLLSVFFVSHETLAATKVDVARAVKAMEAYNVDSTDPNAGEVALKCLALIGLYELGAKTVRPSAEGLAARLISLARKDPNNGKLGWGLQASRIDPRCQTSGAWDMFKTGKCDRPGTNYMYQTPLAVTCIAQSGLAFDRPDFSKFAGNILDGIKDIGTSPKNCKNCFYYWYGYSPNEVGRFVRNTNVLMGMANAWTFVATKNPEYKKRALQIGNAELKEISAGNSGYYGIDDLLYLKNPSDEAQRVENHVPLVAKGLADMGLVLGSSELNQASVVAMRSWLYCTSKRCRSESCRDWAPNYQRCPGSTYSLGSCFVRNLDPQIDATCEEGLSHVNLLNAYQVWTATSDAGSRLLLRQ